MGAIRIVLSIALISAIARSTAFAEPVCGDGVTQATEQCDDGGICIGGAKAGTLCTSEADCGGSAEPGVCVGGLPEGNACNTDADCSNAESKCLRCRPFGGDGCAANCTTEHDVKEILANGQINPDQTIRSGSGEFVDAFSAGLQFSLALGDSCVGGPVGGGKHGFPCNSDNDCGGGVCTHSTSVTTVGSPVDRKIPTVIKTSNIKFSPIKVGNIACACVRAVEFKTCGGTLRELDGTASTNCTDGYGGGGGGGVCPANRPCTSPFGPGNSGSGVVGCDGLSDTNFKITQDHVEAATMCTSNSQCTFGCISDPDFGCGAAMCCGAAAPVVTFSSDDPPKPGATRMFVATALGSGRGPCSAASGPDVAFGPDGLFCTDDDPADPPTNRAPLNRGLVNASPLVTGTATGEFTNASGLTNDQGGHEGPDSFTGSPLSCEALASGSLSSGALVGALTHVNQVGLAGFGIGDVVVTNVQAAKKVVACCLGDCNLDAQVTVDEILLVIDIALGNADISSCCTGCGGPTIDQIILSPIDNALEGCTIFRPDPCENVVDTAEQLPGH